MKNPYQKNELLTDRIKLRDHLLGVLSKAQNKYRKEFEWPEWLNHERNAMLEEDNLQRSIRNKSSISLDELIKVETMASGHVDYSSKFALYCAELVLDDPMKGTP